jgi:hypothetical protein
MTEAEMDANIQALKELAGRLAKMAAEVQERRDTVEEHGDTYSAAYNMVIRSIKDAEVTAEAMADVSRTRRTHTADGRLASA